MLKLVVGLFLKMESYQEMLVGEGWRGLLEGCNWAALSHKGKDKKIRGVRYNKVTSINYPSWRT